MRSPQQRIVVGVVVLVAAFLLPTHHLSARAHGTGGAFTVLSGPGGGNQFYPPSLDDDEGTGIATDASGAIYVTGNTSSPDFPTTAGALQRTLRGGSTLGTDAFVMKIDASGRLVYSTYLGGCEDDFATGIAVDAGGNAYVIGATSSKDFPTVDAMQPAAAGGFVAKLDPEGNVLFSTYLGGRGGTSPSDLALDASGAAYVTGTTSSPDFPMTSGGCQHGLDAFVAKLSPTGGLIQAMCLGGSVGTYGRAVAVDTTGVFVAGSTWSTDFPTTPGVLQRDVRRTADFVMNGFVAKLDLTGRQVAYSTLLPMDEAAGIAVGVDGAAYIAGRVTSGTVSFFTPTPGAFQTTPGDDDDAVVVKLDPEARSLVYATFLGGSGLDGASRIALDADGAGVRCGRDPVT